MAADINLRPPHTHAHLHLYQTHLNIRASAHHTHTHENGKRKKRKEITLPGIRRTGKMCHVEFCPQEFGDGRDMEVNDLKWGPFVLRLLCLLTS